MNKYLRGDTLKKLIEKIYGITTVNFTRKSYKRGKSGEVLINQNGLFDKNSYKLTKHNNFDALFDITFNVPECIFKGNNRDDHTEFTRDIAVQNAIKYFEEFGIKVSNCFENKQEKNLFSKLIYKLISTELLPVIFNTDDNREKREVIDIDMDDITSDFTIAINNAKAILELKDIVSMLYRNAKMSDIETLYDNDTKDPENECNFVTCMCIEDFYDFKYEPWTFDPSIRLNIASKPYEIYNYDGADFSISIDKLKKLLLLQTNDAEAVFEFPEELYIKQRSIESITINCLSNTASFNFLPRYFYYAPNLDQYSSEFCKENFSILWSEVTVYQKIKMNAAEALRTKYRDDFKKSFENVLESIITNTDMLVNVDYGYLLSSKSCEEQEFAKALGNMWQDINKFYVILYEEEYKDSDIKAAIIWLIEYSVSMLNNAIEGIVSLPHRIGAGTATCHTESSFITQLRDYISKYDLRKFVKSIEAYFDKLQMIEELFEDKNKNVSSRIEEISKYISIDVKSDFNKSKKKLSDISLDGNVFKRFHDNLTMLTSIIKE